MPTPAFTVNGKTVQLPDDFPSNGDAKGYAIYSGQATEQDFNVEAGNSNPAHQPVESTPAGGTPPTAETVKPTEQTQTSTPATNDFLPVTGSNGGPVTIADLPHGAPQPAYVAPTNEGGVYTPVKEAMPEWMPEWLKTGVAGGAQAGQEAARVATDIGTGAYDVLKDTGIVRPSAADVVAGYQGNPVESTATQPSDVEKSLGLPTGSLTPQNPATKFVSTTLPFMVGQGEESALAKTATKAGEAVGETTGKVLNAAPYVGKTTAAVAKPLASNVAEQAVRAFPGTAVSSHTNDPTEFASDLVTNALLGTGIQGVTKAGSSLLEPYAQSSKISKLSSDVAKVNEAKGQADAAFEDAYKTAETARSFGKSSDASNTPIDIYNKDVIAPNLNVNPDDYGLTLNELVTKRSNDYFKAVQNHNDIASSLGLVPENAKNVRYYTNSDRTVSENPFRTTPYPDELTTLANEMQSSKSPNFKAPDYSGFEPRTSLKEFPVPVETSNSELARQAQQLENYNKLGGRVGVQTLNELSTGTGYQPAPAEETALRKGLGLQQNAPVYSYETNPLLAKYGIDRTMSEKASKAFEGTSIGNALREGGLSSKRADAAVKMIQDYNTDSYNYPSQYDSATPKFNEHAKQLDAVVDSLKSGDLEGARKQIKAFQGNSFERQNDMLKPAELSFLDSVATKLKTGVDLIDKAKTTKNIDKKTLAQRIGGNLIKLAPSIALHGSAAVATAGASLAHSAPMIAAEILGSHTIPPVTRAVSTHNAASRLSQVRKALEGEYKPNAVKRLLDRAALIGQNVLESPYTTPVARGALQQYLVSQPSDDQSSVQTVSYPETTSSTVTQAVPVSTTGSVTTVPTKLPDMQLSSNGYHSFSTRVGDTLTGLMHAETGHLKDNGPNARWIRTNVHVGNGKTSTAYGPAQLLMTTANDYLTKHPELFTQDELWFLNEFVKQGQLMMHYGEKDPVYGLGKAGDLANASDDVKNLYGDVCGVILSDLYNRLKSEDKVVDAWRGMYDSGYRKKYQQGKPVR